VSWHVWIQQRGGDIDGILLQMSKVPFGSVASANHWLQRGPLKGLKATKWGYRVWILPEGLMPCVKTTT